MNPSARLPTRGLLRASWQAWWAQDFRPVGPLWLRLAWTLVFCLACAVVFTVLGFALFASGEGAWRNLSGWVYWYGINLRISLCIGLMIHLLHEVSARLIGRARLRNLGRLGRGIYFAVIPQVGVLIGGPVGLWWGTGEWRPFISFGDGNLVAAGLLMTVLTGGLAWLFFSAKARQIQAERQAAEAALRLLQGQIEPHFLFNSLANVVSLIEVEPARARALLESFIAYLRASLSGLRQADRTLADELTLVSTYLDVLGHRMSERLQIKIDVPEAHRHWPLPALLLQPLVENAIHHGLEPKIEGGTVQISSQVAGSRWLLRVDDDGMGLDTPNQRPGTGTALANIRQRLLQQMDGDASLTVEALPGGGARSQLDLPCPVLPTH